MHIHPLRLLPGQDLKQEIQAFARRESMSAGWMLTCVGSLTQFHLRYANQPHGSRGQGHFEILSLVGTLSLHGLHLHLCLGDEQGRTLGGHLLEGNLIYTTAELVIGSSPDFVFTRQHDGSTPYPELHIQPKQKPAR